MNQARKFGLVNIIASDHCLYKKRIFRHYCSNFGSSLCRHRCWFWLWLTWVVPGLHVLRKRRSNHLVGVWLEQLSFYKSKNCKKFLLEGLETFLWNTSKKNYCYTVHSTYHSQILLTSTTTVGCMKSLSFWMFSLPLQFCLAWHQLRCHCISYMYVAGVAPITWGVVVLNNIFTSEFNACLLHIDLLACCKDPCLKPAHFMLIASPRVLSLSMRG